jgi:hypothetical protein
MIELGVLLTGTAESIKVLTPSTVAAFLAAGGTRERLDELLDSSIPWQAPPVHDDSAAKEAEKKKAEADEDLLNRMVQLYRQQRFQYEQRRAAAAQALGVRPGALDDEVQARQETQIVKEAPLRPHWATKPWPDEVDGHELITEMIRNIHRYNATVTKHQSLIAALMCVQTWNYEDTATWLSSPAIDSPVKDSGKTTFFDTLRLMMQREASGADLTPAVVFRLVDDYGAAVCFDEMRKMTPELEQLANSGHKRGSGNWRLDGNGPGATVRDPDANRKGRRPRFYSSFGPRMYCGKRIWDLLDDTTQSRCIRFLLRRPTDDEMEGIEDLRGDTPEFKQIRSKCLAWTSDNTEALVASLKAHVPMPPGFVRRLRVNYELLFAIADLCGYGAEAREAAVEMETSAHSEEEDDSVLLLHALHDRFHLSGKKRTYLTTEEMVEWLTSDKYKDAPWNRKGKLTKTSLRKKYLSFFHIRPETVHYKEKNAKGELVQEAAKGNTLKTFSEAFKRYKVEVKVKED